MTELINEGVCRAAPATPGLVISLISGELSLLYHMPGQVRQEDDFCEEDDFSQEDDFCQVKNFSEEDDFFQEDDFCQVKNFSEEYDFFQEDDFCLEDDFLLKEDNFCEEGDFCQEDYFCHLPDQPKAGRRLRCPQTFSRKPERTWKRATRKSLKKSIL